MKRVIKSRSFRRTCLAALMGEMRNAHTILVGRPEVNLGDLRINGDHNIKMSVKEIRLDSCDSG
jgi:hypothetical protein